MPVLCPFSTRVLYNTGPVYIWAKSQLLRPRLPQGSTSVARFDLEELWTIF